MVKKIIKESLPYHRDKIMLALIKLEIKQMVTIRIRERFQSYLNTVIKICTKRCRKDSKEENNLARQRSRTLCFKLFLL